MWVYCVKTPVHWFLSFCFVLLFSPSLIWSLIFPRRRLCFFSLAHSYKAATLH
jgi:dolichyl-phosphate-mannose--protein O-mannosyl transferase